MLDFLVTLTEVSGTTYDLAGGMEAFKTLVQGIVDCWTTIIGIILTSANWILLLPVLVYVFVVCTSSLRAFYKG